ncbi:TRAP transporter substrate-binding protein [Halomonas urumqiensis]|uniref:C4-dicarboxylate ABC transporter substrate-binding protein n=1 Tax=Halomonas urumqiensis TaxID=1684789 RepID=A0A2N7UCK3_9GAMM|nr:TRAP transporter substrate-binding protein [Halomonas urumqiensis]PMR78172.1 C4-dicarboxylate ABC transporter substrate-binding protein [Halomonas urumqiensis]PTB03321.1 C4-dicarboxylate ABC transporter substrate-binding protein [Halomonas urumqiensis]GHE20516.1 transporter [Halomonas urumqiensis]
MMTTRKTLVSAIAIGMTVVGSHALAQDIDETNIAYVGSWSSLSLFQNFERPFWGEHIPEASGGNITTDVTTFDQMGLGGGEVYRLMGRDVIEVTSTVADYAVQDAPELEGLDMPMIAPDVETAREVAEAYRPVLADAFAERFDNAKLLAVVPYPSQMVFCNAEIDGLGDLAGKKVRASGRTTAEFLEALGAEGITLNFSEVPGALQRGVIDCAVTGSLSGYSSGWYEVSTHLYPLPVGGWDHVVTAMNGGKWESLSAETQEWLMAEIKENYEDPVWESAVEETREGIACLTGEGECTRGEPGDMVLVEATDQDFTDASRHLEETLLPNWAERVDQEWVDRWNETIGSVTGLTASK